MLRARLIASLRHKVTLGASTAGKEVMVGMPVQGPLPVTHLIAGQGHGPCHPCGRAQRGTRLRASTCPSLSHCSHLGNKPADGKRSVCVCPSLKQKPPWNILPSFCGVWAFDTQQVRQHLEHSRPTAVCQGSKPPQLSFLLLGTLGGHR